MGSLCSLRVLSKKTNFLCLELGNFPSLLCLIEVREASFTVLQISLALPFITKITLIKWTFFYKIVKYHIFKALRKLYSSFLITPFHFRQFLSLQTFCLLVLSTTFKIFRENSTYCYYPPPSLLPHCIYAMMRAKTIIEADIP